MLVVPNVLFVLFYDVFVSVKLLVLVFVFILVLLFVVVLVFVLTFALVTLAELPVGFI